MGSAAAAPGMWAWVAKAAIRAPYISGRAFATSPRAALSRAELRRPLFALRQQRAAPLSDRSLLNILASHHPRSAVRVWQDRSGVQCACPRFVDGILPEGSES